MELNQQAIHKARLKQVIYTLESTPKTLAIMLSGADERFLNWRPAETEWSIKEVLGHLIACDDFAFSQRVKLILEEDNPTLSKWDMLGEVVVRQDNERSLSALLDELAHPRLDHIEMINQLSPTDLQRSCVSRIGPLTMGDFVFEWAYHDLNHIAQIATNFKQSFEPFMGETMRGALS
jgi:hypothetical protein